MRNAEQSQRPWNWSLGLIKEWLANNNMGFNGTGSERPYASHPWNISMYNKTVEYWKERPVRRLKNRSNSLRGAHVKYVEHPHSKLKSQLAVFIRFPVTTLCLYTCTVH